MDKAATVIGLTVTQVRRFFAPDQEVPPLGGGTDDVNLVAGEVISPPPWVGDDETACDGCGPYLWVRLVRRWRTEEFPTEAVAWCWMAFQSRKSRPGTGHRIGCLNCENSGI
ncbi:hypothetical protein [Nocardia vaccinii]|uniref:hypothetical protein n=1 Tax=Nocardia vaccinii TaxID=1822 RepID=UPI000831C3BA|nr:hypothetical protein [Nocardia vaccinii]